MTTQTTYSNENKTLVNPAEFYLRSQSNPISRKAIESDLEKFAKVNGYERWQDIDWSTVEVDQIQSFVNGIVARGTPTTAKRALTTLRGVAKQAFLLGYIPNDKFNQIKSLQLNYDLMYDGSNRSMNPLDNDKVKKMIEACWKDSKTSGSRDAALIALAAATGVSCQELLSVRVGDVQETENGCEITFNTPNGKSTILVENDVAYALKKWLSVRGKDGDYLFCALKRNGVDTSKSILPPAAYQVLSKRAKEAGVGDVTWYEIRRLGGRKVSEIDNSEASQDMFNIGQSM
ncbi:MAG: site-specific integrase [Methylacidiphilales bacterium]|nr:site-specific integrase [Candidatus Methylacidiphilales bacterium]